MITAVMKIVLIDPMLSRLWITLEEITVLRFSNRREEVRTKRILYKKRKGRNPRLLPFAKSLG